ncbi:MAG: chromosomal replication initiator protein DnaA [Clostridia bacterium]|nr:chromosomal replication initiator protein DnaA [Clostridia bacterium]
MYTPEALLDAVLRQLRAEMGEVLVDPWFTNASPIAIRDNVFVIEAASELFRDTLTNRFTDNVSQIISGLLGYEAKPIYVFGAEADSWRLQSDTSVYAGYTFEKFIVGNSNKFAHAAALAVSNNPARQYNPLFIYGGSGLGKTHLLFAIANSLRKKYPSYRIVYIKSEDFMNEMVEAVKTSGFTEFRAKYRQADLLLMDDVQFLSGRQSLQEEFFHTFESLFQANKQIVLTSDRPPKEIATLSERLQTRFESGLLADVQSPDLETRMAMVKAKANNLGIEMPQIVVSYIAENITNNVRELEGAVKKIAAINSLMGSPIDLLMAQEAIKDIFKERPGLNPTAEMVLKEVSAFYSVPADKITGKAQNKEVVLARKVASFLMRELCSMSYPEIGKVLNRDHTSVIYGVETLTKTMAKDESLRDAVSDMKKNIQSL